MTIYIEEIISEKTENQNELYFLIIWNSTAFSGYEKRSSRKA